MDLVGHFDHCHARESDSTSCSVQPYMYQDTVA